MKTLLICHAEAPLDREGLARWLASFSNLAGLMVLHEGRGKLLARAKREIKRIGWLRFLDVVAFRFYYRLVLARQDAVGERALLERLRQSFPPLPSGVPTLHIASPNSAEAEAFIRQLEPDIVIARCKVLLKKQIFDLPARGTFVLHPGICPAYRNAHGCFWALAQDDLANVGLTLLQIDEGVDTGPVYGYYCCGFDEIADTHLIIQARAVFENLDALRDKLCEINLGTARPVPIRGGKSAVWGQPWLSRHLAWKRRARFRARVA